jgi:hypothetical protein
MDGRGEPRERSTVRHGIRDLADHLAGVRRDDRAAAKASALVVYPHEPVRPVVHDGAIDFGERHVDRPQPPAGARDVPARHADVRQFGIGVGHPRDDERARLLPAEEERILNRDPRQRVGGVGELVPGAHVARGKHAPIRRPQPIVHRHALFRRVDAGRLQTQVFDVGRPAGRHEDRISRDVVVASLGAPAPREAELHAAGGPLHAVGRHAEFEPHAVGLQRVLDNGRRVGVLARQHLAGPAEHRHAGAEAREGLRQLAADRSRADDEQIGRQIGEREDGLVREVRTGVEPGDRWRGRTASGGDDRLPEPQACVVDDDRPFVGEGGGAEEHVHARGPQTLGRIVGRDRRAALAHAPHDGGEIDANVADRRAQ